MMPSSTRSAIIRIVERVHHGISRMTSAGIGKRPPFSTRATWPGAMRSLFGGRTGDGVAGCEFIGAIWKRCRRCHISRSFFVRSGLEVGSH
jgi:hypothetical protein